MGGVTVVLPNLAPKSEAKSPQQLPGRESFVIVISNYLRSITLAGRSKSAADKPSDYLSANQRYMGFNNPANPYLAAVQALIAFCHRRISRHALTLTATAPLQMMSGKQNERHFAPRVRFVEKRTASLPGRGPTSQSDDVTLPEPPRRFCLGFGLAERQVVIT